MYLIDTNVFLEALLGQHKAPEVRSFFQKMSLKELFITDPALHSKGIILSRLKKFALYNVFVDDMIINGMAVLSLIPEEHKIIESIIQRFNLDFDDACHYAVSLKQPALAKWSASKIPS
ncbi:MAG: PIN domain-containing protein [Vulcanimicrobiota bacterium]